SEPQPEQEQSPDQDNDRENFFYLIDKPLGIVTVTAPRSLLAQVETYLETLKKELSRQVMIEAKIIEVQLDSNTQKGIDWSELFKDSAFTADVTFGYLGQIYPRREGAKFIGQVELSKGKINLLLNFLEEHGNVKVLSNPKLALLNGQPAMITVGENVHYIDNVTTTIDSETKTVTYTVETNSILSGIGFGVMASISSDDEVILHITPVTSKLQEPIEYRDFGTLGGTVGLPRVLLRELTTVAKVKSGQLLIIGGLIDEVKGSEGNKVPLLGDVPLLGNAFKNSKDYTNKRELIIFLQPQIVGI
ncbi:MAG: pilus (MSHA type) biogenesis protein MshL, partial [Deltaproteobacteria bacterium]|nr:pilus (MSHA type) biogenesis protein MshL [Deltaproteobacteria bacterium]